MRLIDADALRRKFEDAETQLCLKGEFGVAVGINVCFEALDEAETCSPQPDPETGLVRCGCGIALTLDHNITMNEYRVVCYGCGWRTTFRVDKEKVIKIANIAMGYREAGE